MDKFKKLSKNSILISWIIAYVTIFSIPLITGFRTIALYNAEYEKEIKRKNEASAELVISNLTDSLKFADAFYMETIKSQYYAEMVGNINEEQFYHEKGSAFLKDVSLRTATLKSIELWYIYSIKTGNVFALNGIFEDDFFYQTYFGAGGLNYEEWKKVMSSERTQRYGSLKGFENSYLWYSIPMRSPDLKKTDYVLSFLINTDVFFKNVAEIKETCTIKVKDSDGKEIYSLIPSEPVKKSFSLNDVIMVNTQKMDITVEIESYAANTVIRRIKRILTMYMFVDLILGILLIIMFLRRNYDPIARIIMQIGENNQEGGNELSRIEKYMKDILTDNEKLQDIALQREKDIKSLMIKQSMFTSFDENEAKNIELLSEHEKFLFAAFYMQNPDEFVSEDHVVLSEKISELNYIVSNVLDDLLYKENFETVNVKLKDLSLFMIKIKDIEKSTEKDLNEYFEFVVDFINLNFGGNVYVVTSKIYSSANEINTAYSEIRNLVEKRETFGGIQQVWNDEASGNEYNFNIEKNLRECIRNNDFIGAKKTVNLMLNQIETNSRASETSLKTMLLYLAMTVTNLLSDIVAPDSLEKTIEICTNVENTRIFVFKYLDEANNRKQEKYNKSVESIFLSRITKYIEENYSDANLNVNGIGNELGITPSYMSKIFKEKTGKTIPDTINRIRIEKAKELLNNPEYRIEDISNMIGFGSVRTFNRTFKTITGVSPSEFSGR